MFLHLFSMIRYTRNLIVLAFGVGKLAILMQSVPSDMTPLWFWSPLTRRYPSVDSDVIRSKGKFNVMAVRVKSLDATDILDTSGTCAVTSNNGVVYEHNFIWCPKRLDFLSRPRPQPLRFASRTTPPVTNKQILHIKIY
ncbi:hypothetical protein MAR_010280 [Mya arenaria]|uniref:Uncharacterized protein n=1 Tax=Mya arenaria TaxID=6604 RepID=A0ABY7E427_MYAAR|nr:hypothetical protein MAR_010280 [Mya arenaria]